MRKPVAIPGQFPGTRLLLLAVRGGIRDPMPEPASGDLTTVLEDRAEYSQHVAAALRSDYTWDVLDGAAGAAMLGNDGDGLVPLFGQIMDDCQRVDNWHVIERVEGVSLQSTLCMIRVDLLIALREMGSPRGLPLAVEALSDRDDAYHTFAIDLIKAIGPAATDAVPNLVQYICAAEKSGQPADHHQYRRGLRRDACEALGAVGSREALAELRRIDASKLPTEVRDAARQTLER